MNPRRGRVRRLPVEIRWLLLGLAWVCALVFGMLGSLKQFAALGEDRSWLDAFYRTLQLFVLEESVVVAPPVLPWELEVARLLAPAVAGYTALAALAVAFREQLQAIGLRFARRHAVVCGLGDKGARLAEDLLARGERVVAIDFDANNANIADCRAKGATVLVGHATDESVLRKARAHHASNVFALCKDDSTNLATVATVATIVRRTPSRRKRRRTTCHIHLKERGLRFLFGGGKTAVGPESDLDTRLLDVFENSARSLLAEFPPDRYAGPRTELPIHVIVAGFEQFGQDVVLQAMRMGHYASGKRLRITVLDSQAGAKGRLFNLQYPQAAQFCDIRFLEVEPNDPGLSEARLLGGDDFDGESALGAVYVCLEHDSDTLSCAVGLLSTLEQSAAPIVACLMGDAVLGGLFEDQLRRKIASRGVRVFGVIAGTCTGGVIVDEKLDTLAKAVQEAYQREREKEGKGDPSDPSQSPWDDLAEDYRNSCRQQADNIEVKLRAVGCRSVPADPDETDQPAFAFTDDEVELLARMEHARYNGERFLAGWTLGPKDLQGKKSPYLVGWDELTEEIKDYDRQPMRNIPSLLRLVGRRVVRDEAAEPAERDQKAEDGPQTSA